MVMEYKLAFTPLKLLQEGSRRLNLGYLFKTSCSVLFSSSAGTDTLLDHLVVEVGGKRDRILSKYFEKHPTKSLHVLPQIMPSPNEVEDVLPRNRPSHNEVHPPTSSNSPIKSELTVVSDKCDVNHFVRLLERNISTEDSVPDDSLHYILVHFAKNGNVSGVKAVQVIVKKYNFPHFTQQSEYNHYLAEALWINGRVEDSLKLFVAAYDNSKLRNKIKVMLTCLFPLLTTQHGESTVRKTVYAIERLSSEKEDHILLGCLWKELFQSTWFSDQQLSKQILQQNPHLLQFIQWMIPTMGKDLLKGHKVEVFYRLIEFTLENDLRKFEGILLRLLFDFYCKYASSLLSLDPTL